MNAKEILKELETLGTAQNRKVYARHGYPPDATFGVSFANLGKLRQKISVNHALAGELWASGNADARILACQIADPQQARSAELDRWVKQIDFYVLADSFARYVAATPFLEAKIKKWTDAKNQYVGQAGWSLIAFAAMNQPDLPDSFFEAHLRTIAAEIHQAPNRTRHAMNQALIAIGVRNPALTRRALEVAAKIGKVEVDHGETSCTTPDAASYIRKTLEHMAKGEARRARRAVR